MTKVHVYWEAAEVGQVSVFGIYNTSHNCLYVLARDADEAMNIAYTANHVYGTMPIIWSDYGRHAFKVQCLPSELDAFSEAIDQALSKRLRGTLHVDGDVLKLGNLVIS